MKTAQIQQPDEGDDEVSEESRVTLRCRTQAVRQCSAAVACRYVASQALPRPGTHMAACGKEMAEPIWHARKRDSSTRTLERLMEKPGQHSAT